MHQFPIIRIPEPIKQVKSQQPPIPMFLEQPPVPPGSAPEKPKTTAIALQATPAVVPGVIIASQPGWGLPGFLLLLALGAATFSRIQQQLSTYSQKKAEHERQVAQYMRKARDYEQKQFEHQEAVQAARTPANIAAFQYKLLREVLSQTKTYDSTDSRAQRGRSEAVFGEHLKRYFADKVHTRLALNIPDYEHPYSPDFAYIDKELHLHIDIEVDEPYTQKKKRPTHFVGAQRDEKRNNFFIDKGWIVIRFSEEQVVRYPDSCCKTIAKVIVKVTGDESMLSQFAQVPNLETAPQWTEQEAKAMAAGRLRDSYRCA
jgi:very-short-patch-repair endonuclease